MISRIVLAVLATAVVASAAPAGSRADQVVDHIILEMHHKMVQSGLHSLNIAPFIVEAEPSSFFARGFRGEFKDGSVAGLNNVIRGSACSWIPFGSRKKIDCSVRMTPGEVTLNAEVTNNTSAEEGELAHTEEITVKCLVSSINFRLELIGKQDEVPVLDIESAYVGSTTFEVIKGELDLHGKRLKEFIKQTKEQLDAQLLNHLNGNLAKLLEEIVSTKLMP